MYTLLFIIGIFLIWKGQMQLSKTSRPLPLSKKTGRIIGAILLIPLIVSLLSGRFAGQYLNAPQTVYQDVPTQNIPYIDSDNSFQIIPPTGWVMNNNSKYGLVAFTNAAVNAYSSITIQSDPNFSKLNLDDYVNAILNMGQKTPTFSVISKNKAISANNETYYLIETQVNIANDTVHAEQLIMLANSGKAFIVTGGSNDSTWSTYKTAIYNSLLTFKTL